MGIRKQLSTFRTTQPLLGVRGAWRWSSLCARGCRNGDLFALYIRRQKQPVWMRCQTSDKAVFWQIFLQQQYACVLDVVHNPAVIFDCGANVGYTSLFFLTHFPHAHIVAVEPDPGNFALLRQNLEAYADRVTLVHAAVWPSRGRLQLSGQQSGNEWGIRVAPSAQGDVAAVTIGDLLQQCGNPTIDLLKMDIEGAEGDVFSYGCEWLDRVKAIAIELHGELHGFGPEHAQPFWNALQGYDYVASEHGELTMCTQLRPKKAG